MFEIKYLVWIWKRSFLGFYYRAPVVRTAHVDRPTRDRLGRMFTMEEMMVAKTADTGAGGMAA